MTMSEAEVVDRIRTTLSEWAAERPVAQPSIDTFTARQHTHDRRPATVWLVAAVAAVTIAVVTAVVLNRPSEPANMVPIGPAPSGTTEIPVGRALGVRGLTVTGDAVWVASENDEELYRVDPATNRVVATFPIPDHVEGVVQAGGWLWLSRYEPFELIRIDPATGAVTGRLAFDSQPNAATDGNRLWVVADRDGATQAVEIDPATAAVVQEIGLDTPPGFAAIDGDDLWFASFDRTELVRVDLTTHETHTYDVMNPARDVVVVNGSVWVATNKPGVGAHGTVVRVDPVGGKVTASVTVGRFVHSLAPNGDTVWATNFEDGTLSVIDADRAEVIATTPIGDRPGGVAAGHGSMWVTPHRRPALVRIDSTQPLEAAAEPDLERAVEVASGTVYVRCSGSGGPTVLLEANQGEGSGSWAVVEARLSRVTRVCAYDRVGVADPEQAGQAGPAGTIAADFGAALAAVEERGPFVVVGQMVGALYAQMFAATHREDVVGLVLVDPVSPDFFDRLRPLLTPEAQAEMDRGFEQQPELRAFDEGAAQVAATDGFGDVPLVVVSIGVDVDELSAASGLPRANAEAVTALIDSTRRSHVALSSRGQFVTTSSGDAKASLVEAIESLVG